MSSGILLFATVLPSVEWIFFSCVNILLLLPKASSIYILYLLAIIDILVNSVAFFFHPYLESHSFFINMIITISVMTKQTPSSSCFFSWSKTPKDETILEENNLELTVKNNSYFHANFQADCLIQCYSFQKLFGFFSSKFL